MMNDTHALPFGSSGVENRQHCASRVSTSLDTNGKGAKA
jgi:hypothetical protein